MQKINHQKSALHYEEVAEVEGEAEVGEVLRIPIVLQMSAQFVLKPSQIMRYGCEDSPTNSVLYQLVDTITIIYYLKETVWTFRIDEC